MPNGPPNRHARRGSSSLADESVAIAAPSITSKQPTECQVVTESCEWCMVDTPWTGDDDDSLIESDAEGKTDQTKVVAAPKGHTSNPALENVYGAGQTGKTIGACATTRRNTLGPRMLWR